MNNSNKGRWLDFIKKNWSSMSNKELSSTLGIGLTSLRTFLYEHGFKRMELEYWTDDQVRFLKKNFRNMGDTELASEFNKRWKKKKKWTIKHIEKKRKYLNLNRTKSQVKKILKGHVLRGVFREANLKKWKKFQAPQNEIRVWFQPSGRPFKVIKTKKGFVYYSRWLWKEKFGKIPKGKVVGYKDDNPLNCTARNLVLRDRKESVKFMGKRYSGELNDSYIAGILSKGNTDIKKVFMASPELLKTKRLSLQLNRNIKSRSYAKN